MRIRPQATQEQRQALQATLMRIQRPEVALEIVRSYLNASIEPESVVCTLQTVHPDRFVMKVRVRLVTGETLGHALKVYADDFGAQMWAFGQALAEQDPSNHTGLCLPRRYLHRERTLVFPWVDGVRLSDIVDDRKPDLLRRAAALAADLHRTPPNGLPTLTPEMVVAEALDRCERLQSRCPSLNATLMPLTRHMEEASVALEPARPALIHGDMAAGQFLWTGDRLVLLDLDAARHADPAYDVGHFLGQLERRCLRDLTLPAHAKRWLACFREAYPADALGVSWRNVSFYQGVTLVRKMYTVSHRDPVGGPRLATRLAERARAAFESVQQSR
jgi:phosphotransferase family enzyme